MSDDTYQPSSDRDDGLQYGHYTPVISQHHYWEQKEREEAGDSPERGSSPCPFRSSAVISRGVNEGFFDAGGDLDSQIGSLAWAEMRGYTDRAPSVPRYNPAHSESPKIKTEEIDVELLQLRCTDLEADKERLEEELAQLRAALTKERNEVA
ncbi:hypothetical protein B0H11DRAFT_1999265, partial [Mycena galericulata]